MSITVKDQEKWEQDRCRKENTINEGVVFGGIDRTVRRKGNKIGRNEPCPCGSVNARGVRKKYKHCCLPKVNAVNSARLRHTNEVR